MKSKIVLSARSLEDAQFQPLVSCMCTLIMCNRAGASFRLLFHASYVASGRVVAPQSKMGAELVKTAQNSSSLNGNELEKYTIVFSVGLGHKIRFYDT